MKLAEIKKKVNSDEYDFLRTNEHLGENIILLVLGGSHAYGTDTENSDIDIRGISLNNKSEVLLLKDYEQVEDNDTDTKVYSFNKMMQLLCKSNPNVIEILGCKPEHYLVLNDIGKELLDNRHMFLSKLCIHTFGNYGNSQCRRLENKACRTVEQAKNEEHILKSIMNARYEFKNRYFTCEEDEIKLYIDDAINTEYEKEIFMDVTLHHYPLRDWCGMWNEMKSIINSYNKMSKQNAKTISRDKLGKHMEHSLRVYMMCIDILEKEEVITYRDKEHDLLMSIRNGEYLDSNNQPISEFYDLVKEYEKRFDYAKENTSLPDVPDYKKINEFLASVNERIVKGEI